MPLKVPLARQELSIAIVCLISINAWLLINSSELHMVILLVRKLYLGSLEPAHEYYCSTVQDASVKKKKTETWFGDVLPIGDKSRYYMSFVIKQGHRVERTGFFE